MAIKKNGAEAPEVNAPYKNTGSKSVGFGGAGLGLLGATRGAEYTSAIAKVMTEMYANIPNAPKINIFDKERMTNLAYSCIVVSAPAIDSVVYHITLLEATGTDPMKASDIVAEATRAMREPGQQARIYTPDDAINGNLHNIVLNELANQYHSDTRFVSADGMVVHQSNLDVADLAMRIAAIAYNSVSTEVKLSSGEYADLNVTDAIRESGSTGGSRSNFKLETNLYHTTAINIIGAPTRQAFKVDMVEVEHATNFELNADTRRRLVSVSGYIEALRADIPIPTQPGMAPMSVTRLHPNIIMSNNDTVSPTEGFMLLGLAAGTVMSQPELWLQSLASIDAKSTNSPGGLNIITNIENAQNGTGTVLDFSSKSVTSDEHYAALKRMYSQSPLFSYDVESFGPQSYYTSVLAAAAAPEDTQSRFDALSEIIETCVQLTNGNFPSNFPVNEVFATSGIVIPMGYWMDKSGERDIRDVDMAFIANQSGDVNMINKWCMSSLPRNITGHDPFLTKVEIINNFIPDAVINGKAVRVMFANKFIEALTRSIEAAGLSAQYESGLVFTEQYDQSQFDQYLATASLSQASGFAHQYAGGGNGIYTNYSGMGHNRF